MNFGRKAGRIIKTLSVIFILCFTLSGCDLDGYSDYDDSYQEETDSGIEEAESTDSGADDSGALAEEDADSGSTDQESGSIEEEQQDESDGDASADGDTDSTEADYQYTEWNPEEYPDMYRVSEEALVSDPMPEAGVIKYGGFDALGRTLPAEAVLTHDNYVYGQRERADIEDITPSGWGDNPKVSITFPNGVVYNGFAWNRSHLIAHSLGGEDAAYNMITGTRAQNVGDNRTPGGMEYCETKAMDYLSSHPDNCLYYSATPVYEGDEPIPRSVFVDMYSDDGSIDEEVEVFNALPGFSIDYMTGAITPDGEGSVAEEPAGESTDAAESQAVSEGDDSSVVDETNATYIANDNKSSRKFHKASCGNAAKIADRNRVYSNDRQELIDEGYTPAKCCNP